MGRNMITRTRSQGCGFLEVVEEARMCCIRDELTIARNLMIVRLRHAMRYAGAGCSKIMARACGPTPRGSLIILLV